jgi:ribA/ribD-fused uncharacterized protein
MEETISEVKKILDDSFKRKLSETSVDGNSPKQKPPPVKLPEDTPEWGRMLFDRIKDIENHLTTSVDFIVDTAAECLTEVGFMKNQYKEQSERMDDIMYQVAQVKSHNKALQEKVVRMENQSRRDNLLFYGISEEKGESDADCLNKVYELLARKVGIPIPVLNRMSIVRGHRKGVHVEGKNRPIIVKFHYFPDKQHILSCAKRLKGTYYFINEDYAVETEKTRRMFYPILKKSRQLPQFKDKVFLHVDNLIVDGKAYTTETLQNLPEPLNPAKLASKVDDHMVRFFGKASPFSNFATHVMMINNVTFCCNAQQYLKGKGDEFGDDEAAARIMATTDPVKMYSIGQHIKDYDESRWRQVCDGIMLRGLKVKFNNPKYKALLLETGNRYLAECNGRDTYWSTGVYMEDTLSTNRHAWQGDNKLGKLLMQVRDILHT